jgi:hypothetical protein
VFLELGEGDIEGEQSVLAGLSLFLKITGDGGFDFRVAGKPDEQQHDKRKQRERDEQRETAGASRIRRTLRAKS